MPMLTRWNRMALRSSDGRHYQITGPNPLTGNDWGLRKDLPIINEEELGELRDINHCRGGSADIDGDHAGAVESYTDNAPNHAAVPHKPESSVTTEATVTPVKAHAPVEKLWEQSMRDQLREKRRVVKPSAQGNKDPLYGTGFFSDDSEDL